jgi:hypothetical protein
MLIKSIIKDPNTEEFAKIIEPIDHFENFTELILYVCYILTLLVKD